MNGRAIDWRKHRKEAERRKNKREGKIFAKKGKRVANKGEKNVRNKGKIGENMGISWSLRHTPSTISEFLLLI